MPENGTAIEILVYADWTGKEEACPIGKLHMQTIRSKEIMSFAYDKMWLTTQHGDSFDPDLRFYEGSRFPPNGKDFFGLALDQAPLFGLKKTEAENLIAETKSVVDTWRTIATALHIPRNEQDAMQKAFSHS